MKIFSGFFKATVIGGLLFMVPLILMILVLQKGLGIVEKIVVPIAKHFPSLRMMGSTAISRSLRWSHSTTPGSGSAFVGSLRTLASTRYLKASRWIRRQWVRRSPSRGRPAASRPHLRSFAVIGA